MVLEVHSEGEHESVAREIVGAVAILTSKEPGGGGGGTPRDGVAVTKAELIGGIEVEAFRFAADSDTEKMAVEVGGEGAVVGVFDRAFTEDIPDAAMPAFVEVTGHPELIDPAVFPIESDRNVVLHWEGRAA